ncbi:hypothetical protein [Rhizobium sp. CC1099]|uniref:hypothetical protein n=1 Tax=Rhizobium sp. CC1099 TaxID=3039160 RepID=UPI0032C23203
MQYRASDALSWRRAVWRRLREIDISALASAGIPFANNPDYGTEEVADHALAMILSLHRRPWEHDARARGYTSGWQVHSLKPRSRSNRTTVGVVGVGRIGTAVY